MAPRALAGRLLVVKIGGDVAEAPDALHAFCALLQHRSLPGTISLVNNQAS